MYNQYIVDFLFSLIFTITIETAVLFILIKHIFKEKSTKTSQILFTGFIASFATLPYLWFVLSEFITNYVVYAIVGEISVTLVEWIIIRYILKLSWKKSLIASIICNASSVLLGLIFL